MTQNKRKKFILSKWRPSFSEMVARVFKKRSSAIAESVMRNNPLLRNMR